MKRRDLLISFSALVVASPALAGQRDFNFAPDAETLLRSYVQEYFWGWSSSCSYFIPQLDGAAYAGLDALSLTEKGYSSFAESLAAVARDDFDAGRTVMLDGWIVPESELPFLDAGRALIWNGWFG